MTQERFIVTGGLGCIGAWVTGLLARDGHGVVVFDAGRDDRRLRLVADTEDLQHVTVRHGDLAAPGAFANALREHAITHVVHLAALQAPYCRDDPVLGAQVNVVGHVNVFEAARQVGLATTIAYASSAAARDPNGGARPSTLYGAFKLVDEAIAAVYAHDHGIGSLGLRAACVYGPGRDRGTTAAVTEAILAAAEGRSYRIPFGGGLVLHYAADVAQAFIDAARSTAADALVRTMPNEGPTEMTRLVTLLDAIVPGAGDRIEVDEVPLPFPPDLPGEPLEAHVTPLEDGIRATIAGGLVRCGS